MKKTTVVHLITLLEMGGAQGNTIFTVKHLDKEKFEAHLWTGRGAYWDKDVKTDLDLSGRLRFFPRLVRPIHFRNDVLATFQLWRALVKLKPAILHTHSSKAGIVGRLAGWLARIPVIVHTYHGFGFNKEQNFLIRNLFIVLEKLTAPLSHKLIFVSSSNMKTATELKIGKPAQYLLIHSGVSLQNLKKRAVQSDRKSIRKQFQIPEDHKVVLTVGPHKPQKNLMDFIHVGRDLFKKKNNVTFLIIGDGEQRPQLEALVNKFNLKHIIIMPGWRQDMPEIYAASDVFALTSLWEGLPRAMVEAMALGLPAVCYETDGVSDLLSQGGGLLVKQKDVAGMVDALERVLGDDLLYSQLSQQARHMIGEEFDINAMVIRQEDLYQQLLLK